MVEIDKQAEALRVTHEYLAQLHDEAQAETAVPAKSLRNEMVQILRDTGKPLHYTELRNQLENRGVSINGVDKAKTVGAHLSNDPRFKKLGKGMWALASWPASVATLDDTDDTDEAGEPDEPFDVAFSTEEPLQEPPRPQRPMRPVAPEREEKFAAEDFDDVPF